MAKPRPGKFEGCEDIRLAEVLYGMSLDGDLEDEAGGRTEWREGWHGLLVHRNRVYILHEDTQGFFTYTRYTSPYQAAIAWAAIAAANTCSEPGGQERVNRVLAHDIMVEQTGRCPWCGGKE